MAGIEVMSLPETNTSHMQLIKSVDWLSQLIFMSKICIIKSYETVQSTLFYLSIVFSLLKITYSFMVHCKIISNSLSHTLKMGVARVWLVHVC